jgi:hypothetical protein
MQWLTLLYTLSFGTVSYQSALLSTPLESFSTVLSVELQAFDNHLFLSSGVETWETAQSLASFAPFQALYTFSAGLRLGGFELGYRHECDHPVISNISLQPMLYAFLNVRNTFYISFKGKLNVF